MSVQIQCTKCQQKFWVKGFYDPGGWTSYGGDPPEVVISDNEDFSECCEHLQSEECYEITDVEDDEPYYLDADMEPYDDD